VFLEKYLDDAKHIEVQVFGDAGGKVHSLFDRECSVQRRHQKIVEEALSAALTPELRRDICNAAVKLAQSANYRNAGTVEFLLQGDDFYFMEMNTRLQVEHPVTEMVLGVDLVKAQLLTAMNTALPWADLQPRGHAIECRIYAEDPYRGVPCTGRLEASHWPQGPGRRFEIGFEPGDEITANYDSMIAKVIVWDETRSRAIQKMKQTLSETVIFGLHTNIPLLQEILSHKDFATGVMTTRFFETQFHKPLGKPELSNSEQKVVHAIANQLSGAPSDLPSPWQHSWRQP
jgi:3-methylcrotonyl-CoA carboxylase alpha subunit